MTKTTVAPTCTKTGTKHTECSKCHDSYNTSIPATGHSYSGTRTVNATCTTDGAVYGVCSCGAQKKQSTLKATGHNYVTKTTKKPTCTKKGNNHTECTKCHDAYDAAIPATGHSYSGTRTVNATCTTDGAVYSVCSCGAEKKVSTLKATGHNYVTKTTKNPTCTKTGTNHTECSKCHDSYDSAIPATGHSYSGTRTVNATCTTDGAVYGVCSCGAQKKQSTLKATGHNYISKTTKYPTCTATGIKHTECSKCHDSYDVVIPANGHSYTGSRTVNATCTEAGAIYSVCPCGAEKKERPISALGHNYEKRITKNPTCTNTGIEHSECSRCHHSYDTVISALGHNYSSSRTVNATCTKDGAVYSVCSCGAEIKVSTLKATGHNYVTKTTKTPTCTQTGIKRTECSNCHDFSDAVIPANGHSFNKTRTVSATCTKQGAVYRVCDCGAEELDHIISKLDHDYVIEKTTPPSCLIDGEKLYRCKNTGCNATKKEILKAPMSHGKVTETITKSATCTEKGTVKHTCSDCGETWTTSIPITDHNYSETRIQTAGCETDGAMYKVCSVCGAEQLMSTRPATGHNYTILVEEISPSDFQDGHKTYKCSNPDCESTRDIILPMLHAHNDITSEIKGATCEESGKRIYTCQTCGEEWSTVLTESPALGHSFSEVIYELEPTCFSVGIIDEKCTNPGCDRVHETIIDPVPHDYDASNICKICSQYRCDIEGHTYNADNECSCCGRSYCENEGHTFTRPYKYEPGANYSDEEVSGTHIWICDICGAHSYQPHNYCYVENDDEVTGECSHMRICICGKFIIERCTPDASNQTCSVCHATLSHICEGPFTYVNSEDRFSEGYHHNGFCSKPDCPGFRETHHFKWPIPLEEITDEPSAISAFLGKEFECEECGCDDIMPQDIYESFIYQKAQQDANARYMQAFYGIIASYSFANPPEPMTEAQKEYSYNLLADEAIGKGLDLDSADGQAYLDQVKISLGMEAGWVPAIWYHYSDLENNSSELHYTDVPDKGFSNYPALKRYLGSAGEGNNWHHLVEQSQIGRRANFSSEQVNNVNNVVSVPAGPNSVHNKISRFYSLPQSYTNGLPVRDWLSDKSFDFQFDFGIKVLREHGEIYPTSTGWVFIPR